MGIRIYQDQIFLYTLTFARSRRRYLKRAIHNGAHWQDDGAKKDTMWLGKSMNGADLPVFLLEVNGANPVFYLYF